mmetsp:Transcript_21523/g.62326  ORF Transcript_21523/g.62326 Transcript_21523/m.62326 type:complete len:213 (-) Transcript_21523:900-1538(-)
MPPLVDRAWGCLTRKWSPRRRPQCHSAAGPGQGRSQPSPSEPRSRAGLEAGRPVGGLPQQALPDLRRKRPGVLLQRPLLPQPESQVLLLHHLLLLQEGIEKDLVAVPPCCYLLPRVVEPLVYVRRESPGAKVQTGYVPRRDLVLLQVGEAVDELVDREDARVCNVDGLPHRVQLLLGDVDFQDGQQLAELVSLQHGTELLLVKETVAVLIRC